MDEREILKNENLILTKNIELLEEIISKLQKEISYLKTLFVDYNSDTDKYFT